MPALPVVVVILVVDFAEQGLHLQLFAPLHVFLQRRRHRCLLSAVAAGLLGSSDELVVER